jgi:CheY-like chemotaxis protein
LTKKPRILVVQSRPGEQPLAQCAGTLDLVYADSVPRALVLLQRERFDGVYADTGDMTLIRHAGTSLQADRILEKLSDGVAVIDADRRILWANAEFERWCGGPVEGRSFNEALGSDGVFRPDCDPLRAASSAGHSITCQHPVTGRFLELHISPSDTPDGQVSHFICVGRDVTAEKQQQQKLDAIHQAGRELAALDPRELDSFTVEERIDLLKTNIERYTRELFHYDVIDIRLLDSSGRLVPLITEGMPPEAAQLQLRAERTGNGVTGYVAATGKSYYCPDTAKEPLYIKGLAGARSSLTVPLIYHDKVVGTFNVESPNLNGFTEQDRQYLEIFSREIAAALHTLELLVAEKRSTASQSVELINREVAMPVDEILTSATALLDRYIGHDKEMAGRLQHILASARSLKQCINRVGETIVPVTPTDDKKEPEHPTLKGLRVLVADNDDRVRRSAHAILGRFGCVVETARDGKEALVMARLSPYDVVLADIRLPDMPGFEIFRRLREISQVGEVILMSAYGYDPHHSIVKAKQDGLRRVLFKPFRVDQLLDALERKPEPPPPTPPRAPVAVGT